MTWIRRCLVPLACLPAAALLAACGGGSEPGTVTTAAVAPATTEPPAEPATTAVITEPEEPAATTDQPATTEHPHETEAAPKPLPGLPRYTAGYDGWTKLNRDPIPPTDSDPHLGTKDVFSSEEAERSGGMLLYPDGTVIVKHAFRPDRDFIGLIAIMRKEKGADPEHNDWVFVEYTRDSPDEPFTELARDSVCWSCHMGAAQTDYVWVHATGAAP
jgi:hypothetical protein